MVAEASILTGETVKDVRKWFDDADSEGRRAESMRLGTETACGIELDGVATHECITKDGLDVPLIFRGSMWELLVLRRALTSQKDIDVVRYTLKLGELTIVFRCQDADDVRHYLARHG